MRRVLIVGAGQCGLQLGLGLLAAGYEVTVVSGRTADEIRWGRPTSTQAMFAPALATEQRLGLNLWEDTAPPIAGLHVSLSAPPGRRAMDVIAPLDSPAHSVDQRLKMPAWLELFEQRGGTVSYRNLDTGQLDALSTSGDYDLTVVAAGRGELTALFERDPDRSPYTAPQRGLAVSYVHGMAADPVFAQPSVGFNAVPGGFGELFVIPGLTLSGPCDMLLWEVVPGGPLDVWEGRLDAGEQLERAIELAREYLPWVADRCRDVELTDARATLSGRFTPTVRQPVAQLPSGGLVLGAADTVITNDPITGQGSNTAAHCATAYLNAIVEHGDRPFDRDWMQHTFDEFWAGTARYVTEWTNAMLQPFPSHLQKLLGTAAGNPTVARRFANGFAQPRDFFDWLMSPEAAESYLASLG